MMVRCKGRRSLGTVGADEADAADIGVGWLGVSGICGAMGGCCRSGALETERDGIEEPVGSPGDRAPVRRASVGRSSDSGDSVDDSEVVGWGVAGTSEGAGTAEGLGGLGGSSAGGARSTGGAGIEVPSTKMGALQFLQAIFTRRPRTFSSAIAYFRWQDEQVTCIGASRSLADASDEYHGSSRPSRRGWAGPSGCRAAVRLACPAQRGELSLPDEETWWC